MNEKIIKSVNDAYLLANVLKNVYKSSIEEEEKIAAEDVVNMLNLIIEKVSEIKNLCTIKN